MKNFSVDSAQVFKYFEEICAIPRGSGNMDGISKYCMRFAEENGLRAICDEVKNVVIYKDGTKGLENAEPIVLQGHLDMVCQKTAETEIDFLKDGLKPYTDGDFIKAKGTTLGADNGIAVSMIMAVLASKDLPHPPIEAVFTSDEEIGMLGAAELDTGVLKSRRMINLDAEESEIITVSCAGGSDVKLLLPTARENVTGTKLSVEISGLKGGHSGVDIDKRRANANILAGRLLENLSRSVQFDILSINGGTKSNAIPFYCNIEIVTENPEEFKAKAESAFMIIKKEISEREGGCSLNVSAESAGKFEALDSASKEKLIYMLFMTPDGIVSMSAEIEGLVETSLNLGVLMTAADGIVMQYALRSNKQSAIEFLEDKLRAFASYSSCGFEASGRYAPWEFREDSPLRKLYIDAYTEYMGKPPQVAAIHAGLECAVFTSRMDGLDCIAVGPDMFDVHTVNERLSISSTEKFFGLLCKVLSECK